MKTLIYIHGFNSAPQSQKAQACKAYFERQNSLFNLHIAAFPPAPKAAVDSICEQVESIGKSCVAGFIGSSLGGYYSLFLHDRYGLPAALINPAMRPYELLVDYLGENQNLYTGERYVVTAEHMGQLKALDRLANIRAAELFLLQQTADEVLDFKQACTNLKHVKQWLDYGGDHAFADFERTLPAIEHFFARQGF